MATEPISAENLMTANELKTRGNDALKQGKLDVAEELYTECVAKEPSFHLGYANRGLVRMKLEKWELALKDLTKCLELRPGYVKALLRRATTFEKLGKRLSAYRDWRRVVDLQPNNSRASREAQRLARAVGADLTNPPSDSDRPTTSRSKPAGGSDDLLQRGLEALQGMKKTEEKDREKHRIFFGQFVVGPPGSGKTTYCTGMKKYLEALGRKPVIVNLDPANETMPYEPAIDIQELITLQDAMEEFGLGPNGGMIYCLEFLSKNLDWLRSRLDELPVDSHVLFDCPGQVELYVHHQFARDIAQTLWSKWDHRLVCVNLVDSHHIASPTNFISILLTCLSTMIHLELPHVNVLTKADLLPQFIDSCPMDLDFYTQVQDLRYLISHIPQTRLSEKFRRLNDAISETIMDFNMVAFHPLDIGSADSIKAVLQAVDKGNGYSLLGDADHYAQEKPYVAAQSFDDNPLHSTSLTVEKPEVIDYDAMYGEYEGN